MDSELPWGTLALIGVMLAFAAGWIGSRLDLRQWKHEQSGSPKAYYQGLNLLLNEQQDKAIDAFIEAMRQDPGTAELHFALGNLFRRRGEYERAVRVHEYLLARSDLPEADRHRARHGLAQDFMKAGLFDRAEAAFRELDGTAFATDARLELLNLYERTRDWRAAIESARKLEAAGAGSFATRIAHHWCEIAEEADARQRPDEAEAALAEARAVAPQAPRPLILAGQRLAAAGRHAEALALWNELFALQPTAASLLAADYAASALATGDLAPARERLAALQARQPSSDTLNALLSLETDAAARTARLQLALQQQPTLSTAAALLKEQVGSAADRPQAEKLAQVVGTRIRPLQRYRCAACGFEAQHYFWQCPGCQTWDSYPPVRLDDQ
jgi:lipopolysaccharide biosynthesis regulator YciM